MTDDNENINTGFIKIYRSFISWEWYGDPNTKSVFLHLIISANFEDKRWRGKLIKRGQLITSLEHLATDLGLSVRNVRTALSNLSLTGEILKETTNRFTLITICNFDKYQDKNFISDKQTTSELTNERQTNDKQTTTTKEYKERKENISSSSSTRACVRAREPIQNFLDELKTDRIWLEAICMNNHISPIQFDSYLDAFLIELRSNGNETAESLEDAKRHFNSWLRIRKQAELKNKQNGDINKDFRRDENPTERIKRILSGDIRS